MNAFKSLSTALLLPAALVAGCKHHTSDSRHDHPHPHTMKVTAPATMPAEVAAPATKPVEATPVPSPVTRAPVVPPPVEPTTPPTVEKVEPPPAVVPPMPATNPAAPATLPAVGVITPAAPAPSAVPTTAPTTGPATAPATGPTSAPALSAAGVAAAVPVAPLPAAGAPAAIQATIDKGLAYLKSKQYPDGGWQADKEPPALTAIVVKAFLQEGKGDAAKPDFVKKGLEKLLASQVADGGFYVDGLANYNTSIVVSALASANDPAYKTSIDKGVAYLKGLQWTERSAGTGPKGEKVDDPKNPWYGGVGYGGHARPDGSNLTVTLDALKDAGLKPEDPAFQAALVFVQRQQNRSESNDQPWAGEDGGAAYTPANNGESPAGEYTGPDGRRMLRSYGGMTYAMLKSYMYAGLKKDDPRVKAAWDWITKNWTLDENPGMRLSKPELADDGLFYYYHVFARALNAYDEPVVTDSKGQKHDWRLELAAKLASLQQADGQWVGDKRWMESKEVLTTAYAILALQEAKRDLAEHPAQ